MLIWRGSRRPRWLSRTAPQRRATARVARAQSGPVLSQGGSWLPRARQQGDDHDRQAADAQGDRGEPRVGGQRQEEADGHDEGHPGDGGDEVLGDHRAQQRRGRRALAAALHAPAQQQHLDDLADAGGEHAR